MIKNMYIQLYKEWTKGDLIGIKKFMTDRMYNQLEMEILDMTERGLKNEIKDIKVKNVDIIHREERNGENIIVVEIEAQMISYITDTYGNIKQGSPDVYKDVKEYWKLVGKMLNWKLDEIKKVEG